MIHPIFQVISSYFFKVDELLEQKLCKVKINQLQAMSNAIRCIDQRVQQSCMQKNWFPVAKYNETYTFFPNNQYKPIAVWLRRVAVSLAARV